MGKVSNTKGSFQKKLAEMKKKIKQTNQDANACDTGKCKGGYAVCHFLQNCKRGTRGIRAFVILLGR